jgi:hypothetical protein
MKKWYSLAFAALVAATVITGILSDKQVEAYDQDPGPHAPRIVL